MNRKKRGVIFDLDGTLVDSRLNFDAMRRDLNFSSENGILETIAAVSDQNERRRLEAIVHSHEVAGAQHATAFQGAHELIRALTHDNIQVAVFTRNSREIAKLTLANVGLEIPLIVAREDAPPKPNPAGLQLILAKWNLEPNEALFVGDFLYDLEAGRRASIPTLLFAPGPPDFSHDHQEIIYNLIEVTKFLGKM